MLPQNMHKTNAAFGDADAYAGTSHAHETYNTFRTCIRVLHPHAILHPRLYRCARNVHDVYPPNASTRRFASTAPVSTVLFLGKLANCPTCASAQGSGMLPSALGSAKEEHAPHGVPLGALRGFSAEKALLSAGGVPSEAGSYRSMGSRRSTVALSPADILNVPDKELVDQFDRALGMGCSVLGRGAEPPQFWVLLIWLEPGISHVTWVHYDATMCLPCFVCSILPVLHFLRFDLCVL